MKTTTPTKKDTEQKAWYVVDAKGKTLGRLATAIATVLNGKHKPQFAHHMDMGDYVVVTNADKFVVTGKKLQDKEYFKHTGWMGGESLTSLKDMLEKKPTFALKNAVAGMLPKNKLRKEKLARLKLYTGDEHDHAAQQPQPLHI